MTFWAGGGNDMMGRIRKLGIAQAGAKPTTHITPHGGPVGTTLPTTQPVCPQGYAVNDAGVCAPVTTDNSGNSSTKQGSTTTTVAPPKITGQRPSTGLPGTLVTVNGVNLGSVNATITVDGELTASIAPYAPAGQWVWFKIPIDAQPGPQVIAISTPGGMATTTFTVTAPASGGTTTALPPTISSQSLYTAAPGTALELFGNGFVGTTITIDGMPAQITAQSATSMTVVVPNAAAGFQVVTVENAAGQSATTSITVTGTAGGSVAGAPVVTSLSAMTGDVAGTQITAYGSGLTGATVEVGGVPAQVVANSASQVTFIVPPNAPVGIENVSISTVGGTASSTFTVTNNAALTSTGTTSGGTTITSTVPTASNIDPNTGATWASEGYLVDANGNLILNALGQPQAASTAVAPIIGTSVPAPTDFLSSSVGGIPMPVLLIGLGIAAFLLYSKEEKGRASVAVAAPVAA